MVIGLSILFFLSWYALPVQAQVPPPPGDRFTLVLPSDPFKWEHSLNELGQRGWDGILALQPGMGGLTLHLVTFVKPANVKTVAYKVIVAEFSTKGDASLIEATRLQLEIQGNAYSQNGWQLVQPLTGSHGGDKAFLALIFKKAHQ
jgi:hypothetical protein